MDPEQAATLNQTYASHYIAYSDWYRKADADPSSTQVVTTSEDYRTESAKTPENGGSTIQSP